MIDKNIKMERSPFYKERNEESKDKDIKGRVSSDVFNELELYFNKHYGDKSKGVRDVLIDFLNNLCQERQYFRNMKAILLLPKTFDPDELNDKCKLIGFIDVEDNFTNPMLFQGGAIYRTRHKLFVTLEEFNKEFYTSLGLDKFDKSVLFNVSKDIQDDFDKVQSRLSELYPDIDVEDSYFVMFNINNYLDIENKGQFHSKSSAYTHEGVIVLLKDFDENVCLCLKWHYFDEKISLSLEFHHISYFNETIHRELLKNGFEPIDLSMGKTASMQEKLERQIDSYESQIKHFTQKRDKAIKDLNEIMRE